jgi:predicted helicase
MKFEAGKGEHFFRSTLVQTLFYGVFSAWVLWHKEKPQRASDFDWKSAAWSLHVPMISALFDQVATPTKLGPLGLVEVLNWTAGVLNRVDRAAFFAEFLETHAVQYFYEPFLEAFDPELRKQLGVWYTPPEIAQYQVARVDTALREELGIPDGLADPRVFVLDPCCGTGVYLVEVLRRIHKSLKEDQGMGALAELYTKKAAQERVFGFELLPAPFVVAHLHIGLLMQSLGLPFDDVQERAAIYLTNALTGWEPPTEEAKKQLALAIPEFQREKEAADGIKQDKPIIVILGNPPYNGFAGLAVGEERELSDAYRTTKRVAPPQGQGLNELYVRFFRMAERRIVEKSGQGIVSFISNYSWLDGRSHPGMRERYLEVFDSITVDCLNGDKFATGKRHEGKPDPSAFSTEFNHAGIEPGTAIVTLVCKSQRKEPPCGEIQFRDVWGRNKRAELLESLQQPKNKIYVRLKPPLELGLPFRPMKTESGFFKWPLLTEIFPVSFPGVKTSRDDFLVNMDKEVLFARLGKYFDPKVASEEMRGISPRVMKDATRFAAIQTRDYLRERGMLAQNFVRYYYRPFDVRWLYWEPETKLLDEKRAEYFVQIRQQNVWLAAVQQNRKDFDPPIFTKHLCSLHVIERGANLFPLWLEPNSDPASLFHAGADAKPKPNLTDASKRFLVEMQLHNEPEELFYHTLAVLHAPEYRVENSSALRQDWPRIPLPNSREALLASASLGRQVAALLDTEKPVDGITNNARLEFKTMAVLSSTLNLSLTAGWGHAGQNGVTMPGKGKMQTRSCTAEESAAVAAVCDRRTDGGAHRDAATIFGGVTHDIYLNDTACWGNVPEKVWDYTIGGYQVMKKWLSYREFALLGRALTPDEAREVTQMARRIAALILLQPELDANYQRVKSNTFDWKA